MSIHLLTMQKSPNLLYIGINKMCCFLQFWCWPCGSLKWRPDTFGWLPWPGPAKFGSSNASRVFPVSIWLGLWSQLAKIDVEGLFHCQRSRVSPDAPLLSKILFTDFAPNPFQLSKVQPDRFKKIFLRKKFFYVSLIRFCSFKIFVILFHYFSNPKNSFKFFRMKV